MLWDAAEEGRIEGADDEGGEELAREDVGGVRIEPVDGQEVRMDSSAKNLDL